ncbi:hypothetical protein KOW79_009281 [Hemibagrus wyckioides]|uniref:Uncharacterized protein n=1 Tax=Hemibagrus wyckioides TaxID=337641 RepID=A0A9D3NV32_9TELE|nr:hypothetical protein KOW79_009281 [Hemibagrus wyckioides]
MVKWASIIVKASPSELVNRRALLPFNTHGLSTTAQAQRKHAKRRTVASTPDSGLPDMNRNVLQAHLKPIRFDSVLSEDVEPDSGVQPQQKGNCAGGEIRPNGNGFTQHLGTAGLLVHTVWCDQSVLHD